MSTNVSTSTSWLAILLDFIVFYEVSLTFKSGRRLWYEILRNVDYSRFLRIFLCSGPAVLVGQQGVSVNALISLSV